MADHVRKQIRDRAATVLTGLTTTGSRVYKSRPPARPLASTELPGLLIYTTEEDAEIVTLGETARSERALTLMIEGHAQATASLDDTLDAICKEVEVALGAVSALNTLAHAWHLARTESDYSGEGEQPIGVARMHWTVNYSVDETAPDVPIV